MTVSSLTTKNSYSGNGSTSAFSYTFKIFDDDDVTVIIRTDSTGTETVKTKTTHYTVSGVGSASGGTITFTSGNIPASGETVLLLRNTPLTQATDYTPNDPFPAATHEDALDKLTLISQDTQEEIDRSIKLSRANTMTSTEFTVPAATRANKIFAFDSSGELAVTQEIGTFRGDWAASTAYAVRDLVKDTSTNNIFIVNEAHTSSGAQPLTTNANSAKYDLIVDAASATSSASAAASSATAAASSASTASTQASNASSSASTASTQASNASTSASAAATSATAAATSATAASSSATAAASSATSAASSAASLTTGISENNVLQAAAGVADDDFLRVDGTKVEGRSASEVLSDIGAAPAAGDSNIVTTGALNSGSITSGFGTIDTGSSAITTTGVGTFGSLDISGDIDVDGTTNLDVVDIDGAVDMASTLQVSGSITSSDSMTITVDDNADTLVLKCTDADAVVGPILVLQRDSGSPADNDALGFINFTGDDDGGTQTAFATIAVNALDVTSGTLDGEFKLSTIVDNNLRSRMQMTASETVLNEDSIDLDFRVEGNGNANAFFVQGSDDFIGIGTGAPKKKLHILDTTSDGIIILDRNGTSTDHQICFAHNYQSGGQSGGNYYAIGVDGSENKLVFAFDANSQASLSADAKMTMNSSGVLSVPNGIELGLSFDAAASNTLDDYEEGTFTPEIRIGGSTSGITNNSQVGQYTKIGRMVTLTGRVSISNKGSNSGAMTIHGMPFTSQNTSNLESIGSVELQNMSSSTDNLASLTNNNVHCRISPNVLSIEMRRTMIGANDITNVQMTDTTVVSFTITYFT